MHRTFALALSAITLVSCASKAPSTVVVALSSEAPVPDGVSSIRIQVQRGQKSFYDQTFTTTTDEAKTDATRQLSVKDIPGTLTLDDDGRESGPVSVTITALLANPDDSTRPRTAVRVGRASFVSEKQRLLRMPIQFACAARGDECASQGMSCRAGQCVTGEQVDALDSDLEDADTADVVPAEGRCFSKDPIASATSVAAAPIEQALSLVVFAGEGQCSVPGLLPSLPDDEAVLTELAKLVLTPGAAPSGSLIERLNQLRAQTNMGYIWSGDINPQNRNVTLDQAKWTVVDRDPNEGWNFAHPGDLTEADITELVTTVHSQLPASIADKASVIAQLQLHPSLRISVSDGLCDVLQHDRDNPDHRFLLGVIEQRSTASKTRSQPSCAATETAASASK